MTIGMIPTTIGMTSLNHWNDSNDDWNGSNDDWNHSVDSLKSLKCSLKRVVCSSKVKNSPKTAFSLAHFSFLISHFSFIISRVRQKKSPYPAQFVIEAIRLVGWTISRIFWRIEFHGAENVPHDSKIGLVVIANHQTYLDPMWICLTINRKYRFMAWDGAFDWFFVGKAIRYLGAFPVSLERGGTIKAMKEALRALRDGATLIIFPEGEREFSDGELLEFKSGAMRIAMEAGVPVLPVTIRGAHKIWAQDMKLPRLNGKVELIYHPLFHVPKPEKGADVREHIERLTEELKAVVSSKL